MLGAGLGFVLAAATALPALAQSTQQSLSSESVIEKIKQRGAIKVGLSLFVPWSMRDKNGKLIGFELDVARKLAEDMGVDAEFVPTSWDGIIPALVAGKFDVIISGMSITPQRNLTINFSDPYAYSGLQLYANKELAKGFTEEDFNSPDVTFAERRGATPVPVVKKYFPKAKLLLFDEDGAAYQEVVNGNATASIASIPTPTINVSEHPDVLYIPFDKLYSQNGEAFAMRKGDPDALNYFNNWIAMRWRDDFLKERHDYWFGTLDWKDQVAE
jgi:polar amino acid transport system substrate-binding protein